MIPESAAKALLSSLQHIPIHTPLLECGTCPDRAHCGGLQVKASLLSCLDHCTCKDKATCDVVCPRNPSFVQRIREVRGLGLSDVRKRKAIPFPNLPDPIHLIFRSPKLARPMPLDIVAIPFSEVYRRTGRRGMLLTRVELERKFKLSPSAKILLTGVEEDDHVEQWWGTIEREDLVRGFRGLGVICATTPNFSTIADVPRHDNLHSIKRIALSWAELHDSGIPTALHINGRTNYDFERWAGFLNDHKEITAIAFEFLTGAARQKRGAEYVDMLITFAKTVRRPITLIMRGGNQWLPTLRAHYDTVVTLNSDCTMKTRHRQKAIVTPRGSLKWHTETSQPGTALDELFAHNIATMKSMFQSKKTACDAIPHPDTSPRTERTTSQSKLQAHDESLQMSLL